MSSKIIINLNPKLSNLTENNFEPASVYPISKEISSEVIKPVIEITNKVETQKPADFLGSPAFGSILDYFPDIDKNLKESSSFDKKTKHQSKKELKFVDSKLEENYLKPGKFRVITRVFVASLLICSIFTFGFAITNSQETDQTNREVAVAGVMSESPENEGFSIWLKKYNIQDLVQTGDTDSDGLTNWEEYKLGTNPTSQKSCGEKTDGQNLLELIDPKTCQEINLENDEEILRFAEFINTAESRQPETTKTIEKSSNLKELFGADYDKLDKLAQVPTKYNQGVEDKIENQNKKLVLINKINKYIQANRSFEPKDRDYEIPVLGSQYLEISEQSKVPLKYFLAIAKLESRFGTDKFDSNGNQTRPFRFKNIFSMGLDDSGGNIGFANWTDGVKSFGKWYNRLIKVSDCAKWKIYNPNIDASGQNYCQKVEKTASEIQAYLE